MKRSLASSLLAGILLLVLVQHYSVTSARYFNRSTVAIESVDDSANADADMDPNSSADKEKKGGNGFVRVISAPFASSGRLFGAGGKKNDQQVRRISDKDAKKFGSTLATRIKDAENAAPVEQPSTEALSAREISTKRAAANQQAISSALSLSLMKGRAAINLGEFDS